MKQENIEAASWLWDAATGKHVRGILRSDGSIREVKEESYSGWLDASITEIDGLPVTSTRNVKLRLTTRKKPSVRKTAAAKTAAEAKSRIAAEENEIVDSAIVSVIQANGGKVPKLTALTAHVGKLTESHGFRRGRTAISERLRKMKQRS